MASDPMTDEPTSRNRRNCSLIISFEMFPSAPDRWFGTRALWPLRRLTSSNEYSFINSWRVEPFSQALLLLAFATRKSNKPFPMPVPDVPR